MMLPVIISDEELEQHMMKVMKDSLKYIGLVFSFRKMKRMKVNFRRLELLPNCPGLKTGECPTPGGGSGDGAI